MPVVLDAIYRVLVAALALIVLLRFVKRWKRNMYVGDDPRYVAALATLSEGSVRRSFNAYTDLDWESPEFAVTPDDPRWVLSPVDPLGRHPWYRAQTLDRQIAIGMWRQACIAKVAVHFESMLVRGMLQYTFFVPNASPEFRYCMHEAVEECNHIMMFQETVNRVGVDVPGMPRWLRWLSQLFPLAASAMPSTFFFGVLAGEVPFDHLQTNVLRQGDAGHPIVANVVAIHVAEEARHISFADEYLRKRVPRLLWPSRLFLSLYVPIIMRVLCQAILKPPRRFYKHFGMPRSVRRELFFRGADSRQALRDNFGDVRLLCHEVGLMNPLALLVWRLCGISGRPSRYRSEPQRTHLPHLVETAPEPVEPRPGPVAAG